MLNRFRAISDIPGLAQSITDAAQLLNWSVGKHKPQIATDPCRFTHSIIGVAVIRRMSEVRFDASSGCMLRATVSVNIDQPPSDPTKGRALKALVV